MINKIKKEFERFVAKISDRLLKTTKFDTFQRKYSKIYDNKYVFLENQFSFVHVPRTGGTTVHNFLLENSKDFFGGVHSAVSLSCNPNKFKYITIIRDPIDRVYSYYLIQKKFEKLPFHLHAKKGLEYFIKNVWSVRNGMCKFINGNLDIDLDEKLFEISNKNLKNFYFVIDFNNLESDLRLLSKKLDIKVDNIEYKNSYITQKEKLDENDVELITKFNTFDIKLYKEFLKSKQ
tara:strand:+ start:409 stop:1110 length:702 start_codon:yes stop_codon:yes gene_type:complete